MSSAYWTLESAVVRSSSKNAFRMIEMTANWFCKELISIVKDQVARSARNIDSIIMNCLIPVCKWNIKEFVLILVSISFNICCFLAMQIKLVILPNLDEFLFSSSFCVPSNYDSSCFYFSFDV